MSSPRAPLSDGSFFFYDLVPDTYDLSVENFIPTSPVTFVVGSTSVSGLSVVVTPAGSISGSVVSQPGGVPDVGALVVAEGSDGSTHDATTNDDGTYTIDGLPPDTYQVSAGGGQTVATIDSGIVVGSGQPVENIDLALSPAGSVSGQVTRTGGAPVSGAYVVAIGSSGIPLGGEAYTSTTGDYTIAGLPADVYSVQASFSGMATTTISNVTLAAGALSSGDNLVLQAAGSVTGVTTQKDGNPLPFSIVSALSEGNVIAATQADDNGAYTIADLAPGNYTITASLPGFMDASESVTIVAGHTITLPAIAQSTDGMISGLVTTGTPGSPLGGISITVWSGNLPIASAVTASDGSYSIGDLAFGSYAASAGSLASAGVADRMVTVSQSNPSATLDFALGVIGSISGTIFDTDAETPLAGASVTLFSGTTAVSSTLTDQDGAYAFALIAPGTYSIQASTAGQAFAPQNNLVVSSGSNLTGVNLVSGSAVLREL